MLGTFSITISAISGACDSIKQHHSAHGARNHQQNVPVMAAGTSAQGRMPSTTKAARRSGDIRAVFAEDQKAEHRSPKNSASARYMPGLPFHHLPAARRAFARASTGLSTVYRTGLRAVNRIGTNLAVFSGRRAAHASPFLVDLLAAVDGLLQIRVDPPLRPSMSRLHR